MKTIDIKAEILKMKETRSIKEIASDIGLSASTLYKYLRGPARYSIEENSKEYKEINWKSFKKIYNYVIPSIIPSSYFPLYFSCMRYEFKVYPLTILAGNSYRFMLIKDSSYPEYMGMLNDDIMDDIVCVHEESDLKSYAEQLAFVEDYKKNFNIVYK